MSTPPPGPHDPAARLRRIGTWLLLEPLGEARCGVVWHARDERLGREVAVRVLPPGLLRSEDARRRFRREALALYRVHHPHLADVIDVVHENGVDLVVTEYVPGETLAKMLERGRVPEPLAARLVTQIAEALSTGHERGLVHRHLNPRNVMIGPGGWVKLLDFGLPRDFDDDTGGRAVPLDRLAYAAPEQVQGRRGDARADLYALGVMLYEMLTGERPHSSHDAESLARQIAQVPAPRPTRFNRQVSPAIEEIVLMCLEKEPGRRYLTALDLAADLRRLDPESRASVPHTTLDRAERLWAVGWVALGLALVTLVLLGLDVGRSRQRLVDLVATGHTGGVLPGEVRSVAVLPLGETGRDEQQAFAAMFAEDLTRRLGLVPSLRVVAMESVRRMRAHPDSLANVGRELRVDAVITGRVKRNGDRFDVSLQASRCNRPIVFWTGSERDGLSGFQGASIELAQSFVGAARVPITNEQLVAMDVPGSVSMTGLTPYSRGVRFGQLPGPDARRQAAESFRLAIRSDSTFAPAYTALALLELTDAAGEVSGADDPTRCRRVAVNALRALKLDPLEAGAHTAYAWSLWRCGAVPQQAERQFRIAIERTPNDPLTRRVLAAFLGSQDRFAERLAETRHALDRDPLSPAIHVDLARCQLYLHDYGRAERLCRRALEIDPALGTAWETLARAEAASGRWPEALVAQRAADSLGRRPNTRWMRLLAAVRTGDRAEAEHLWRPLRALIDLGEAEPMQAALACDAMGQRDEAMSWLAQACASGAATIEDLRMAPELDSLRSDQRFDALLTRVQGTVAAH